MADTTVLITGKNKILREAFTIGSIVRTSLDAIRMTIEEDKIELLGLDAAKAIVIEYVLESDTAKGLKITSTIGDSPGKDPNGEVIPGNVMQIDPREILEGLKKGDASDDASISFGKENTVVKTGRITRKYRTKSAILIPSAWKVPNLPMTAAAVMKKELFQSLFRPLDDLEQIRVKFSPEGIDVRAEEEHIIKGETYVKVAECSKFVSKETFDVLFGTEYFVGIANYIPSDIVDVTLKMAANMPAYVFFGSVRCILAPRIDDQPME